MPPNTVRENVLSHHLLIPEGISKSGPMCTLHRREIILKCMFVIALICPNRKGFGEAWIPEENVQNRLKQGVMEGWRKQAGRGNLILMQKEMRHH